MKEKIASIQGLRAFAFFLIFLRHSTSYYASSAMLGVSVFFVLSGFLLEKNYANIEFDVSIKNNFRWSIDKIKKLYPLHFITMLFAAILQLVILIHNQQSSEMFYKLGYELLLNVTLLQTWIPNAKINCSLNGVAWYLSAMAFLYFMFPYISKIIKKMNKKYFIIIILLLLLVQITLCIPMYKLFGNSEVYKWFMYCWPIFRMGDFGIGCCLGRITIRKARENILSIKKYTVYEVMAVIISIFICIFVEQHSNNVFMAALKNWTSLFIPLAIIWVVLAYKNAGYITRIMNLQVITKIGDISAYLFLIHYVIIMYFENLMLVFDIKFDGILKLFIVAAELVISIVLSKAYKLIVSKLDSKPTVYKI